MQTEGRTLTELYVRLIDLLKAKGEYVGGTLEIRDVQARLENPYSRLILEPVRKHSLEYLKRETEWYLSGDYSIREIGRHAKLWRHVSDDGETVNSNYGAKLFHERFHGRRQIDYVVDELVMDQDTRRAVMFFSLPHREYHLMSVTKDFPCTLMMQFMIRNGKLDATTYMRSNDLIFGFSNDLPFFSIVQELVKELVNQHSRHKDNRIGMGHLTHNAGSLHVYERHYGKLDYEWPTKVPLSVSALNDEPFPRIKYPSAVLILDDFEPFVRFIRS